MAWPISTKNANFGPKLVVFGQKILFFTGEIKSLVTQITENPPRHLVQIGFWLDIRQNVQKMAIFGPKWPKLLILDQDEDKSVLWAHSVHHHNSREDVKYAMRVSGAYNEPLDRQIMERVQISSFKGPILMNRRNEMGGIRVERTRYRRWGGD